MKTISISLNPYSYDIHHKLKLEEVTMVEVNTAHCGRLHRVLSHGMWEIKEAQDKEGDGELICKNEGTTMPEPQVKFSIVSKDEPLVLSLGDNVRAEVRASEKSFMTIKTKAFGTVKFEICEGGAVQVREFYDVETSLFNFVMERS